MVRSSDVLLILVAILFPPAAGAFVTGCSCDLLINICLTILGYIPGLIHALWLIYKKMEAEERYGNGGFIYIGNGEYQPLYADHEHGHHHGHHGHHGQQHAAPQHYGATGHGH